MSQIATQNLGFQIYFSVLCVFVGVVEFNGKNPCHSNDSGFTATFGDKEKVVNLASNSHDTLADVVTCVLMHQQILVSWAYSVVYQFTKNFKGAKTEHV